MSLHDRVITEQEALLLEAGLGGVLKKLAKKAVFKAGQAASVGMGTTGGVLSGAGRVVGGALAPLAGAAAGGLAGYAVGRQVGASRLKSAAAGAAGASIGGALGLIGTITTPFAAGLAVAKGIRQGVRGAKAQQALATMNKAWMDGDCEWGQRLVKGKCRDFTDDEVDQFADHVAKVKEGKAGGKFEFKPTKKQTKLAIRVLRKSIRKAQSKPGGKVDWEKAASVGVDALEKQSGAIGKAASAIQSTPAKTQTDIAKALEKTAKAFDVDFNDDDKAAVADLGQAKGEQDKKSDKATASAEKTDATPAKKRVCPEGQKMTFGVCRTPGTKKAKAKKASACPEGQRMTFGVCRTPKAKREGAKSAKKKTAKKVKAAEAIAAFRTMIG